MTFDPGLSVIVMRRLKWRSTHGKEGPCEPSWCTNRCSGAQNIAEAIAAVGRCRLQTVPVAQAELDDVELVVVGGPTHA